MKNNNQSERHLPINDKIRAEQVQLITETGENLGVVPIHEALTRAESAALDLVMLAESGGEGVPVTKIMDFGKTLYDKKKKSAEAKKSQKIIQIKEIKIRPKIGEHDYMTKLNQGVGFLKAGKKLKVTLVFRGRENATREQRGTELFERVLSTLNQKGLAGVIEEKDSQAGQFWSRIYSLKNN